MNNGMNNGMNNETTSYFEAEDALNGIEDIKMCVRDYVDSVISPDTKSTPQTLANKKDIIYRSILHIILTLAVLGDTHS